MPPRFSTGSAGIRTGADPCVSIRDMPDPLTREDVQRIAELASLELTEAEVETFTRQLADFLAYAQQVQEHRYGRRAADLARQQAQRPLDRPDDPRPSIPRDDLLDERARRGTRKRGSSACRG